MFQSGNALQNIFYSNYWFVCKHVVKQNASNIFIIIMNILCIIIYLVPLYINCIYLCINN